MRTYTFPYAWGINRVVPKALQTISDYAGKLPTNRFINLTTVNDLGGPTAIYYRINNGSRRSVAVDGEPRITTQGNNTLGYWSVDNNRIAERPHNVFTGINLLKSVRSETSTQTVPPSPVSVFALSAVAALAVIALFAVPIMRKKSRETRKSG